MRLSALTLVLLLAACSPSKQEAKGYAEFIKPRNDQLGQALILHGRLLESFSANSGVLDSEDFIAAEEMLELKLESIGTARQLKALALPSAAPEIEKLHAIFVEAASYLRASVDSITDGGYAPLYFVKAEKQWDAARDSYLKFSKLLFALSGEPMPKDD